MRSDLLAPESGATTRAHAARARSLSSWSRQARRSRLAASVGALRMVRRNAARAILPRCPAGRIDVPPVALRAREELSHQHAAAVEVDDRPGHEAVGHEGEDLPGDIDAFADPADRQA